LFKTEDDAVHRDEDLLYSVIIISHYYELLLPEIDIETYGDAEDDNSMDYIPHAP
jgi:hypothetical protein